MQDSGPIASCVHIIHLFVDVPFGVVHSSTGTGMNQARNAGNQCFNEALCACVSCLRCCDCYLSDYLERFFWTCKNRCGENGNKNQVDVWFPIVFEAVLPFFGAMLGTTVLYQFQCVNYVTAEQDPTEYWIRFYSGWVGWILGFPILSFFFRGAF